LRALWLDDARLRYDSAYPEPTPPPAEALIRLRLAGICNTDLELTRGYMAFRGVLGHEFVGEVLQASDPDWVGRRVVGDINAACYQCETCLAGRHTHCPNRTTLGVSQRDGVFADRFCLPLRNLYPVPAAVPDEVAIFTEPLAAACEILEQVAIHPTDRVVVLGDGKLGLLVVAALRLTGADLTLVGRHANKLAIAQAWGVAVCLEDSAAALGQADVVVACTGNPSDFARARTLVRPRGTLVLKSTYNEKLTLDLSSFVVDEVTLVGSRCGPFEPALRLLETGLVDPTPLISARYALDDSLAAFVQAEAPGVLKVLLHP